MQTFSTFDYPQGLQLAHTEMQRVEAYSASQVIHHLAQVNTSVTDINNHQIKTERLKYKTFIKDYLNNEFCCSSCKKIPTHAVVFTNPFTNEKHLNFFGINKKNQEVLFTHDHTIARSLGGTDTLDNTTTMCNDCNSFKSAIESIFNNHRVPILQDYFHVTLGQKLSPQTIKENCRDINLFDINPHNLSEQIQMLYLFSDKNALDDAIMQLAHSQNLTAKQYLKQCNRQTITSNPNSPKDYIFPFGRFFYPVLTREGNQFLRLSISKQFIIQNNKLIKRDQPWYFDAFANAVWMQTEHTGYSCKHLQELFASFPHLLKQKQIFINDSKIAVTAELRSYFSQPQHSDDTFFFTKKINGGLQFVPGTINNNVTTIGSWQNITMFRQVPKDILSYNQRLSSLNNQSQADLLCNTDYLDAYIRTVCFHFRCDESQLGRHFITDNRVDKQLEASLKKLLPSVDKKSIQMLASQNWTFDFFCDKYRQLIAAEQRNAVKKKAKQVKKSLFKQFKTQTDPVYDGFLPESMQRKKFKH